MFYVHIINGQQFPKPKCSLILLKNNLRIKLNFTKYLKESYHMASDQHFSFKCFPENAFVLVLY